MRRVLLFEGVSFSYNGNEEVLKNVTFSIYEGEVITILGPNGGGKTTLLKLILGFLRPSSGVIKVFDDDPASRRKDIGYLPQFSSVDRNVPITAFEFVKLAMYPGLLLPYPKDIDQKINSILKVVDAFEFRNRVISELSGGQFQRVLFARAIVNDPKILILDEPTNFVDENSRKNFYEIIMSFKKKKTIIIVSHDIDMVSNYTDRVFCLNREIFITCEVDNLRKNLDTVYNNLFNYVEHRHQSLFR
ncbi:MAG: ABC transporter ATP-binding protein [Candidatus Calescibacterium sp.]|nr:ABC transporter ATP-binding protein [Candidatus Calescibacterium sp.]MCX7758398.1 ABC transporter ATP-binding protein [bacterium]MDW8195892.1 ABC transporter ATP-binding protein [Candidatus Calescibacterium sp.]